LARAAEKGLLPAPHGDGGVQELKMKRQESSRLMTIPLFERNGLDFEKDIIYVDKFLGKM
jgi:hypothetical protein